MLQPEKWIDNYSDALFIYALKRLGNNVAQAEDLVQEVFLSAWKNRESYNGTASEKTWLFTICKNKVIDQYRKNTKSQTESLDSSANDVEFEADGHFKADFISKKEWDNKVTHVEQKEFYSVLQLCKSKLKELQQQVFTMKYLQDLASDEICAILGISNQNFWVLMHRAKVSLRVCLEKNWIQ